MKKKILSLLLAVLMICALLPFGAMAADQPVYADLIMDVTSPDDFGMLKDLNGDGLPELFIVWDNGDTPFGQIFTIENGKAKKLIELAYDGLMPGDGQKMGLWIGAAGRRPSPWRP